MLFLELIKSNDIIRRYIVMNSFDGALTILGIVIAFLVSGTWNSGLILISSIGVIVATGISGIWGGYMAEKAERKKSKKILEKHLLKKLNSKNIKNQLERISWQMGLSNGLSSSIVSLIAVFPFFLSASSIIAVEAAFALSLALITGALFVLGYFIAKISDENVLFHGGMMIFAGLVVGIIIAFFEYIKYLG